MARNVNEVVEKLSAAQRKKVEARAAQLIAEGMTLREIRKARKLTQQKIAKFLRIGQEGVSKIEQRSDCLISTLRGYGEAVGGQPFTRRRISRPVARRFVRDWRTGTGF
jgi:DNA-binding XRE family transcriptional regulator